MGEFGRRSFCFNKRHIFIPETMSRTLEYCGKKYICIYFFYIMDMSQILKIPSPSNPINTMPNVTIEC